MTGRDMFAGIRNVAQWAGQAMHWRGLLQDCKRLLSESGDVNSGAMARELVQRFGRLSAPNQLEFFDHLAREFSPSPQRVLECAQAYAQQPSARNLMDLTDAVEPPRQELLRRINRVPGGTAVILGMRRTLLQALGERPDLQAVDADLLHLLSSWFNPGFLELQKVDWGSPARLLEQLIEHEAVHQIQGWDDLRRRLQPDRRCFAFFHPMLPSEPLIFVEVALLKDIPSAVGPLIHEGSAPLAAEEFKVAAFYSISNCQPGLRGVSLGNFLIKRVVDQLKHELPQLRTFCTLSPVPSFAAWLSKSTSFDDTALGLHIDAEQLVKARVLLQAAVGDQFGALADSALLESMAPPAKAALLRLAAAYLVHCSAGGRGDPVARFHLTNGAQLGRINFMADLSRRGLKQSYGLMVNYLYDLRSIDANHEKLVRGEVAHSRQVAALL